MVGMENLAKALRALPWREMATVSEHLLDGLNGMRAADRADRDGVAQILSEMADEILKEAELTRKAQVSHQPSEEKGAM